MLLLHIAIANASLASFVLIMQLIWRLLGGLFEKMLRLSAATQVSPSDGYQLIARSLWWGCQIMNPDA